MPIQIKIAAKNTCAVKSNVIANFMMPKERMIRKYSIRLDMKLS